MKNQRKRVWGQGLGLALERLSFDDLLGLSAPRSIIYVYDVSFATIFVQVSTKCVEGTAYPPTHSAQPYLSASQ